jgi:4-alpha-glucanotransferase
VKLKEAYFLPGMAVLPFLIWTESDGTRYHLPDPEPNSFYYTGTHDNDTLLGWLEFVKANQPELYAGALAYANAKPDMDLPDLVRTLITRVLNSDARAVIIPAQDWLGLNTDARMNLPGTAVGNWDWRLVETALTPQLAGEIDELVKKTTRNWR